MAVSSTQISWTDSTWSPTRGCSRVNSDCDRCYAMGQAHRFSGPGGAYEGLTRLRRVGAIRLPTCATCGLTKHPIGRDVALAAANSYCGADCPGYPQSPHPSSQWPDETGRETVDWSGVVRLVPSMLDQPMRWRKPRRIFVDSMSDLFHPALAFPEIGMVWSVLAWCHTRDVGHVFQILTKRASRMPQFFEWLRSPDSWREIGEAFRRHGLDHLSGLAVEMHPEALAHPLPNVWLGVSAGHQEALDEFVPHLLRCPAAVRFLSVEPQTEEVDLTRLTLVAPDPPHGPGVWLNALTGHVAGPDDVLPAHLDWVITGGESGPGARPFDLAWARKTREQCKAAGVPYFLKQLGSRPGTHPFDLAGHLPVFMSRPQRDRGGKDPSEWPEDLRVQEFPEVRACTD